MWRGVWVAEKESKNMLGLGLGAQQKERKGNKKRKRKENAFPFIQGGEAILKISSYFVGIPFAASRASIAALSPNTATFGFFCSFLSALLTASFAAIRPYLIASSERIGVSSFASAGGISAGGVAVPSATAV